MELLPGIFRMFFWIYDVVNGQLHGAPPVCHARPEQAGKVQHVAGNGHPALCAVCFLRQAREHYQEGPVSKVQQPGRHQIHGETLANHSQNGQGRNEEHFG